MKKKKYSIFFYWFSIFSSLSPWGWRGRRVPRWGHSWPAGEVFWSSCKPSSLCRTWRLTGEIWSRDEKFIQWYQEPPGRPSPPQWWGWGGGGSWWQQDSPRSPGTPRHCEPPTWWPHTEEEISTPSLTSRKARYWWALMQEHWIGFPEIKSSVVNSMVNNQSGIVWMWLSRRSRVSLGLSLELRKNWEYLKSSNEDISLWEILR